MTMIVLPKLAERPHCQGNLNGQRDYLLLLFALTRIICRVTIWKAQPEQSQHESRCESYADHDTENGT